MSGWIEPPDPGVSAEYWVTRRSADAAPGYDHDLPDIRVRYRWVPPGLMGTGSWITGYYQGIQRREANLACLSSANGWRIERISYPILPKDRPAGFVEARRRICPSPHLCLDPPGGTEDAICGPCDDAAVSACLEQSP